MEMKTTEIWNKYNSEVYFFILKKVKDTDITNEILQNSFLKIHQNLGTLKNPQKVRAWMFQIVRNEIANYFQSKRKGVQPLDGQIPSIAEKNFQDFCCFDRFINDLPSSYNEVIELVYFKGKTQAQVAEITGLSLANIKARVRRAKGILIQNFNECCRFSINEEGKLVGESNCGHCQ